jgi:hypothetical protein
MGWVQFRAECESNSKFNGNGNSKFNCDGKFNNNCNSKFNGDGEPGGVEGAAG